MAPPPPERRRAPLTRARIVAAAIDLADQSGFEGLSMRKVAQALGVEAMSLYHHVANKSDLLDGMVDDVFAEVTAPTLVDGGAWQPPIRARCTSLRTVMLRHPWALGRLDSRRSPGVETLRHHDAMIAALRAGGFDVPTAALAFATLDAYVFGFVLQELSLPIAPGEDVADLADEILGGIDPTEFPALLELAAEHVQQPGYAFANEFEPGLDLILDALDRLRPA